VESSVPLLTLLQLRSYLVPCISAPIFIIPKLQNIHWRHSPISYRPSSFNPDWSFREHVSRALPTNLIFFLLRSIRSECLIRDYSAELMLDTLEIIIKWLQVSSECNRQTPHTKNSICVFVSRDLVPSDRATCTIASRVNIFDTKSSPSTLTLRFERTVYMYKFIFNTITSLFNKLFITMLQPSKCCLTSCATRISCLLVSLSIIPCPSTHARKNPTGS
jgi:hypothetical protein